jgi:predicted phosphodiesterase
MLLLCISDIHGNLDALRAVLATAERRAFQKLLVAGDSLFPGGSYFPGRDAHDPLETWRRLTAAGAIIVSGVSDIALATLDVSNTPATTDEARQRLELLKSTRATLGDLVLERVRRLQSTSRITLEDGGELVLVHGSPADPLQELTHDMSEEEMNVFLGDDPADVVVCGASHVPFDRMVSDVRVINVGSVGDAPDDREPGEPPKIAHATWIESTPSGLMVEQVVVPLGGIVRG